MYKYLEEKIHSKRFNKILNSNVKMFDCIWRDATIPTDYILTVFQTLFKISKQMKYSDLRRQ